MRRKALLFLILNLILSLSFVHLTGCSFLKKVASKPGEWLGFKGGEEEEEDDDDDEFSEDEEDEDGEEGDEMSSEEDSDEDSIFGEATEGEEGDPLGADGETEDGVSSDKSGGEMADSGMEGNESSSPEGEGQGSIDGLASGESAQSGEGDSYLEGNDSSNRREAGYLSNQKKSWIPVKKIATQPFKKNGYLVNAVYLVRSGDTLEDISQKIFQTNKVDELLQINSHFKNKTIRSGDKVYYNSPLRPDDNQKLLIYYEDIGLTPNLYISSEGDNIRKISNRLLKDANGWKEIWATNPNVESKTVIPAGIQLRYWGGVTDELAENNRGSMRSSDQLSSNNMQSNEGEGLPDEGQSVNSNMAVDNSSSVSGADPLGPSTDDKMKMPEGDTSKAQGQLADNAAANSDFNYQPPEEDPQAFEPPPTPQPATELSSNQKNKLSLLSNKQDKKLTYGVIGIGASLVILLLLLVARKKKRKKIIDFTDPSSF